MKNINFIYKHIYFYDKLLQIIFFDILYHWSILGAGYPAHETKPDHFKGGAQFF